MAGPGCVVLLWLLVLVDLLDVGVECVWTVVVLGRLLVTGLVVPDKPTVVAWPAVVG